MRVPSARWRRIGASASLDARERLRGVLLAAGQEGVRERRVGHAPAHQHLRERSAHAELALQPRGIRGALGNLEATGLHPGETTAGVGRNANQRHRGRARAGAARARPISGWSYALAVTWKTGW